MMRNRVAATAAGAVIAIGGLGWGIPALADDASTDSALAADGKIGGEEKMAERRTELAERLAAELDLDVADVEAALTKVSEELRTEHDAERLAQMKERLDEAVEEGRLTREQADAMLESAESGDFRGGHGGKRGGRGHGGSFGGGVAPDDDGGAVTPDPTAL